MFISNTHITNLETITESFIYYQFFYSSTVEKNYVLMSWNDALINETFIEM